MPHDAENLLELGDSSAEKVKTDMLPEEKKQTEPGDQADCASKVLCILLPDASASPDLLSAMAYATSAVCHKSYLWTLDLLFVLCLYSPQSPFGAGKGEAGSRE